MLKNYLQTIKASHLKALREQKGQSLIIFTFALLGLIAMLGLALDLGLVYIEQVRVGRTADAAALAAVVELPSEEEAMKRAIEYIELNGYDVAGPNADTRILVRGCVRGLSLFDMTPPGNVSEKGPNEPHPVDTLTQKIKTITPTTQTTGARVIIDPVFDPPDPRVTFMIDTYSYQLTKNGTCVPDAQNLGGGDGDAQKIQVRGRVDVRMNFMQFFGFSEVPVSDVAEAENITSLDVAVVFDISGSMEYETNCYDCWVRQDAANIDYPNNGYYNPLPYNPAWTAGGSSIPHSQLCVAPPTALDAGGSKYLVHEAELYSRNKGNWNLGARLQGQGFWVLQRGSRNVNNLNNPDEAGFWQGNQAGVPANQSSNVCNPGIAGLGLTCIGPSGQSICASDVLEKDENGNVIPGSEHKVDCSAYIKAHPFPTYSQNDPDLGPKLQGAAYNLECFPGNNKCWFPSQPVDDPSRPGPGSDTVPFVEYDFTPKWSDPTFIYIRAIGGGERAFKWVGEYASSAQITDPALVWQNAVLWEMVQGGNQMVGVTQDEQALAITGAGADLWRDNRATNAQWKWIKLAVSPTLAQDVPATLRIFQGSAGYKIDKIVFTNNSSAVSFLQGQNGGKGPLATNGSATRESCNVCNPAYGQTTDQSQCGCPANATEAAAYAASLGLQPTPASLTTGWGLEGDKCTVVGGTVAEPTNNLDNDLFSGLQPLRAAQEALKNFAKRLDTDFDQIGLVAFGTSVVDVPGRRTPLQCQRSNTTNCENEANRFPEFLQALERQWPSVSTNIAQGLKEGLLMLGIDNPSACSSTDPSSNCSRPGAKKILILVTDGSPNEGGDQCNSVGPLPVWNRTLSSPAKKKHYECALYYAKKAADSGVIVYTIGIGAGVNPDFLTAIAEGRDPHLSPNTGVPEETVFPKNTSGQFYPANNPDDLEGIFTQILGNIYVRIR